MNWRTEVSAVAECFITTFFPQLDNKTLAWDERSAWALHLVDLTKSGGINFHYKKLANPPLVCYVISLYSLLPSLQLIYLPIHFLLLRSLCVRAGWTLELIVPCFAFGKARPWFPVTASYDRKGFSECLLQQTCISGVWIWTFYQHGAFGGFCPCLLCSKLLHILSVLFLYCLTTSGGRSYMPFDVTTQESRFRISNPAWPLIKGSPFASKRLFNSLSPKDFFPLIILKVCTKNYLPLILVFRLTFQILRLTMMWMM